MRSNSKHSVEELERYIKMYLDKGLSYHELSDVYGLLLNQSTFNKKVLKYQEHGIAGIQTRRKNNHYSKQLKLSLVKEHLEKGTPAMELARKYNIPAHETVRRWIIIYTNMTRYDTIKTIVDRLANVLSYKETGENYRNPYNKVYSWVQKYKEPGPTGLIDGRGRGKPDNIQTDEEKLHTEIEALKAR